MPNKKTQVHDMENKKPQGQTTIVILLTSSLRTPRNINLTIFLGKNAKNRAFLV